MELFVFCVCGLDQLCFVQAIQHPLFDAFFAGVVFVNAIFTGLEAPSWSWRVKCQCYISWPFCQGPRFWQIHVGMFGVRCPSPPWEPTKRQSAAPEVESSIAHQHSRQLLSDWQIRLSHYIFFILFLGRICDVCDGRNWMELTGIDIFVWNITSHWALPHVCWHLLTFFALWFHIFVDAVPPRFGNQREARKKIYNKHKWYIYIYMGTTWDYTCKICSLHNFLDPYTSRKSKTAKLFAQHINFCCKLRSG